MCDTHVCAIYTGTTPIVLDGTFATFSSALSLERSTAEMVAVDAVPFMADAVLENARELSGNIALVSRGTGSVVEKVKRASDAGAAGIIVINTENTFLDIDDDGSGYKSEIPVLAIKSSDAECLREHGIALIRDRGTLCSPT